MARPVCDHCLTVFDDNPDEGPDPDLLCADAYLFTCEACAGHDCRVEGDCEEHWECDCVTTGSEDVDNGVTAAGRPGGFQVIHGEGKGTRYPLIPL